MNMTMPRRWPISLILLILAGSWMACDNRTATLVAVPAGRPVLYELESGTAFSPPADNEGLVLFYLNPARDCIGCMTNLTKIKELAGSYPRVCFGAVLRGSQDSAIMLSYLAEYPVPGYALGEADNGTRLLDRYGLLDEPALLFYNREGQLVSLLRKTEVDRLIEDPAYFHEVLQQL